jgi:hypothetical protein
VKIIRLSVFVMLGRLFVCLCVCVCVCKRARVCIHVIFVLFVLCLSVLGLNTAL